jgi:hypothetical protein
LQQIGATLFHVQRAPVRLSELYLSECRFQFGGSDSPESEISPDGISQIESRKVFETSLAAVPKPVVQNEADASRALLVSHYKDQIVFQGAQARAVLMIANTLLCIV